MLYVQSLIGLIYRTNLFYDKLDSSKVSNNLWINGFKNFDDFNKTFNDTIKFIKKYINLNGVDPIIDKFMKLTFNNVSKIDIAFLNDMYLFKKYINIYKNFVYGQLKDNKALEKNFMIHSVLPNCSVFGVVLEENYNNLMFSKSIKDSNKNTNIYCIGDSAISYPPGYSLEMALLNILEFIPFFLKTI